MVHLVWWVSRVVITVEKGIFENIDIDIRSARRQIGRASCRERGVDLGGRRIIKKKKERKTKKKKQTRR